MPALLNDAAAAEITALAAGAGPPENKIATFWTFTFELVFSIRNNSVMWNRPRFGEPSGSPACGGWCHTRMRVCRRVVALYRGTLFLSGVLF